jgi:hypothetical protein
MIKAGGVTMRKFIDITGQKFDRLTVQEFAGRNGDSYFWNCVCDCGNVRIVRGDSLKNGNTKSCGCLRKELLGLRKTTHGHCKKRRSSKEYNTWQHMITRCYTPSNKDYKNYGGRGIKVCERWHTFENFYEDMGDCPEGMTLDRKDNNGDYTPENCRWATREEQHNNTRSNHWIEHDGEKRTVAQWEKRLGMGIRSRLHRGWSDERALSKGGSI